jgi:hypothetical protein
VLDPTVIGVALLATFSVGSLGAGKMQRAIRRGLERRQARDALRAIALLTPTTAEGVIARVTGTVAVLDGRTLVAPLTGRPCVAHRSRVAPRGALPSGGVLERVELCPFTIDGVVAVESVNTQLDLPRSRLTPSPQQRDRYDAFLAVTGLQRHDPEFGKYGPEFEEVIVVPGMRITVAGLVTHEIPPIASELGFRDLPPARVRLVGDAEHPIVIGTAVD